MPDRLRTVGPEPEQKGRIVKRCDDALARLQGGEILVADNVLVHHLLHHAPLHG